MGSPQIEYVLKLHGSKCRIPGGLRQSLWRELAKNKAFKFQIKCIKLESPEYDQGILTSFSLYKNTS